MTPAQTALASVPVRDLAGRYVLSAPLGRGGWADVFAAEDLVLHRPVAVKVLRCDAPAEEVQARVEDEIRTLAALRHPGLVTVHDIGTAVGADERLSPFVVMELITGPTLAQRLAYRPFDVAETVGVGTQLASTLAFVHGQGVVHRDLKPANILLDSAAGAAAGGQSVPYLAKLADFGIARLVESTPVTSADTFVGTPNYVSPEQLVDAGVGTESDVYSLGLVLLECLTGQPVYPGVGLDAARSRVHTPPPVPEWLAPDVASVIASMVARDPDDRPTAAEVASNLAASAHPSRAREPGPVHRPVVPRAPALRSEATAADPAVSTRAVVLTGGGPADTVVLDPPAVSYLPATRRRRRRWLIAAALLVVAVVTAVVVLARPSRMPVPRTAYPTVPGQLGRDLTYLQGVLG